MEILRMFKLPHTEGQLPSHSNVLLGGKILSKTRSLFTLWRNCPFRPGPEVAKFNAVIHRLCEMSALSNTIVSG